MLSGRNIDCFCRKFAHSLNPSASSNQKCTRPPFCQPAICQHVWTPSPNLLTQPLCFPLHPFAGPETFTAQITGVTTDPTVPAAQQPYTATVVVLGAFPGQKIQIQVAGSDGFRLTTPSCTVSDVGFPGGAGYCRQTIPGSPWAGSVDTLTASITSVDGKVFVSKKVEVGPIGPKVPK
jgi:hypothetical protein